MCLLSQIEKKLVCMRKWLVIHVHGNANSCCCWCTKMEPKYFSAFNWIFIDFKKKYQIILAPVWGILADFWVPNEIENCNFQNLLNHLKIWYHLDNFYFHHFKGGTLRKNLKTPEMCQSDLYVWPRWSCPFMICMTHWFFSKTAVCEMQTFSLNI